MFRTSCTSLPLILHVVDAKIPSQVGPKLPSLHDLVEAVRGYQSAPDSMDWMYDATRGIVSLSQLQDPGQASSSPSLTAENLGAVGSSASAAASEFACHPSVHLRLALVMDSGLKKGARSLSTRDLSAGIARLFSSDSATRIRALLTRVPPQRHTPSTGAASSRVQSGSSNPDNNNNNNNSRNQTLADWGQVDQSMIFAIELGLVPAEPAAGGPGAGGDSSSEDSASAMSVGTDEEDDRAAPAGPSSGLPHHRAADGKDWREVAGQAFAETGDTAERDVLGAFIFRDQPAGPEAGNYVVEEDDSEAGDGGDGGLAIRDDGDREVADSLLDNVMA